MQLEEVAGAAGISYEYDNEACLIYSQDGVQAASNRYTYYKYDAFYRVIEQGECTGQNNSNSAVVHLKNYYDDYSSIGAVNSVKYIYKVYLSSTKKGCASS